VVAAGVWGGERCLVKTRDRNYVPEVRVVHTLVGGVEVLYLEDVLTGWVEGLNEYGIGIVNSALQVGRDEAEKEIAKSEKKKKSKDGPRIFRALGKKTLAQAQESLLTFKGGIKGHTFLSDSSSTVSIEMTRKHEAVIKRVPKGKTWVRTNHGFSYPDAGYTKGDDHRSSVERHDRAVRGLSSLSKPKTIADALRKPSLKNPDDPYNIVRDTDNMSTTSLMVLNLEDLSLNLYLVPGKVKFKGFADDLPKDYKAKCHLRVFKYGKAGVAKRVKV